MAQPDTPGIWNDTTGTSQSSEFVEALKNKAWPDFFMRVVEPDLDDPSSSRLGVGQLGRMKLDADPVKARSEWSGPATESSFVHLLARARDHHGSLNLCTLSIAFTSGDGQSTEMMECRQGDDPRYPNLVFQDDSNAVVTLRERESLQEGEAPDHPSRWFEPIQPDEYGLAEELIGELQQLLDESQAAEDIRLRVQGAIDVLRGTHRAIEVGETRRIELLSVVKGVVIYLAKDLPVDILKWGGAIKILGSWYPSVVDLISPPARLPSSLSRFATSTARLKESPSS